LFKSYFQVRETARNSGKCYAQTGNFCVDCAKPGSAACCKSATRPASKGPVVATTGLSQFVRGVAKTHEDLSYQSCPARLMAGAATAAGVAVEIFVERNVVPPVGIIVEDRRTAKHWPFALLVAQEYPGQSVGQFQSHLL